MLLIELSIYLQNIFCITAFIACFMIAYSVLNITKKRSRLFLIGSLSVVVLSLVSKQVTFSFFSRYFKSIQNSPSVKILVNSQRKDNVNAFLYAMSQISYSKGLSGSHPLSIETVQILEDTSRIVLHFRRDSEINGLYWVYSPSILCGTSIGFVSLAGNL